MLEAINLKKVYKPKRGVPVNALDGVSVKLPDTGMVFILGKSGSGKSTLLNILGGLDKYDSGDILIKGVSSKQFKQKHFDSYRNTYIGFIFQEYNILEEFSIGANIGLALELQGKRATSEAINDILKEVDLAGMGNRRPNELSGGQKQRVAIARALVKNPEIIMADEPTGALDSKTGRQVFDTLKKLSRTKLVLIVSHDREFSEQYADRIIELADGKIISDVEYSGENNSAVEEKGLNFKENEIEIPDDYVLTQEDMDAINEFLRLKRAGQKTRLGVFSKKSKSGMEGAFVPTDESKIKPHSGEKFKLIKSRLPLKNAFKMGTQSIKHKPVRLAFTILLSVVAFSMFGLATSVAGYDHVETNRQSLLDSNIKYLSIYKGWNSDPDEDYFNKYGTSFTDDEITAIQNGTGVNFKGMLRYKADYEGHLYDSISMSYDARSINSVLHFDEDDLSAFKYSLMGENSRLPKADDEIAITDFQLEVFKKAGYSEDNTKVQINSADDIIGKTLNLNFYKEYMGGEGISLSFKIVGVINTGFDSAKLDRYKSIMFPENRNDMGFGDMILDKEFQQIANYSPAGAAFVSEKVYNRISLASSVGSSVSDQEVGYSLTFEGGQHLVDYLGESREFFLDWQLAPAPKNEADIHYFDTNRTSTVYDIIAPAGTYVDFASGAIQVLENNNYNTLTDAQVLEYIQHFGMESTPQNVANVKENVTFFDYIRDLKDSLSSLEKAKLYIAQGATLASELGCIDYNTLFFTTLTGKTVETNPHMVMDSQSSIAKGEVTVVGVREGDNGSFSASPTLWAAATEAYAAGQKQNDDNMYEQHGPQGTYAIIVAAMPEGEALETVIKYVQEVYPLEDGIVKYFLANEVNILLDDMKEILDVLGQVFLWVGVGFAAFASLMMFNFIVTSINYKKREIGILRAIGSRSNDVFSIFFSESFVIAMINFVLSAGISFGVTMLINSLLRDEYGLLMTILSFGVMNIVYIFAISLGVAFIASFMPVRKIAAKKPIDAIRDR